MAAPPPVVNGFGGAQINESYLSFRPFSGGETGGTYEGLDSAIQPLIQTLFNLGYSVEYRKSKSPISTLIFRAAFQATGGGAPPTPNLDYKDTWELVRNTVQKELLESDHPYVSALSSDDFTLLKTYLNGQAAQGTTPTFTGGGTPGTIPGGGWVPATSIAAANYLYQLFLAGVKTVPVKQPVIRLTRTTSPQYTAPFNTANIDTLLTTASMITDSGLPASFAIPAANLTTALIAKSGGTLAQARNDGLDLQFAWYKDLVSENKHGSERLQFILQYEFGLWDTKLYGNPA